MKIWALADLHLALSTPDKSMEVFGRNWVGYHEKIEKHWQEAVSSEDLVLLPGDITWAKHFDEALKDLDWIHKLKGTKLLLKGNHDYWWPSAQKLNDHLPDSIHFIQQTLYDFHGVQITGSRLWDTEEYHFQDYIVPVNAPVKMKPPMDIEAAEKLFQKELIRLEKSLGLFTPSASYRIAMTHYPPIGIDLKPSRAAKLLEEYGVNLCVFGHLHNLSHKFGGFGLARGVDYEFVAGDYLNFHPKLVYEFSEDSKSSS